MKEEKEIFLVDRRWSAHSNLVQLNWIKTTMCSEGRSNEAQRPSRSLMCRRRHAPRSVRGIDKKEPSEAEYRRHSLFRANLTSGQSSSVRFERAKKRKRASEWVSDAASVVRRNIQSNNWALLEVDWFDDRLAVGSSFKSKTRSRHVSAFHASFPFRVLTVLFFFSRSMHWSENYKWAIPIDRNENQHDQRFDVFFFFFVVFFFFTDPSCVKPEIFAANWR